MILTVATESSHLEQLGQAVQHTGREQLPFKQRSLLACEYKSTTFNGTAVAC